MPKYFDIHSHLNHEDYDSDRKEVILSLRDFDTYTIVVGTNYDDSAEAVKIAQDNENIFACVGIHPVDDRSLNFDQKKFEALVQNERVVAIGECGMDFYHTKKKEDYERQKNLFLPQVEFAIENDLPVMIHARHAYEEILSLLEPIKTKYPDRLRGNVHFFAGDRIIAERFYKIGFSVSFTGVVTFTHDYDDVIKSAPLEMIMAETDAPYATPVPYRGRRNSPVYVKEVVRKIAEIRGEDLDEVSEALVKNALRMIG